MDWGAVVWIALGVAGAGLIAGGVVACRGSAGTGGRASTAGGIVLLAVIAVAVPACASAESDAPAPQVVAVAGYVPLLTAEDVARVVGGGASLSTDVRNMKAAAAAVDSAQVVNMDSWFSVTFQSLDPIRGLVLSVMDFNSSRAAQEHFDRVVAETPGLIIMDVPIGDISANAVFNNQGFGSILMYRQADIFVSLHTAQPQGVDPLMPLEGLAVLALEMQARAAE